MDLQEKCDFTVSVRVRPPIAREIAADGSCPRVVSAQAIPGDVRQTVALSSGSEKFQFSHVFGETCDNEFVYCQGAVETVLSALRGIDAAVIAYGPTGTGKSFTMEGDKTSDSLLDGIVGRGLTDLFRGARKLESRGKTDLSSQADLDATLAPAAELFVSFVQLYIGNITDLLAATDGSGSKGCSKQQLPIGSAGREFKIEGAVQHHVHSVTDALRWYCKGLARRTEAATVLNQASSRSHAIFTVEVRLPGSVGRCHFVDLAGSERVKDSGAQGLQLAEAISINSSLLALTNVIKAVADRGVAAATRAAAGSSGCQRAFIGSRGHIPYRDSKLTMILQRALGGNCKTAFLLMVTAAAAAEDETRRTLRFGQHAAKVRNTATVNLATEGVRLTENEQREMRQEKQKKQWAYNRSHNSTTLTSNGCFPVPTPAGVIQVRSLGSRYDGQADVGNKVAMFLHGYPSHSREWSYLQDSLVDLGYWILAIDMPGFGLSSGERMSSRSEHNW